MPKIFFHFQPCWSFLWGSGSSESLPVSCLQNIHIQRTISTIAINKEPFMPTCNNFISHTLYRKKVFFSSFQYQWSTPAMWKECSLSVHRGHDCALCESTLRTTEGKTRWPKRSFSFLTSWYQELHINSQMQDFVWKWHSASTGCFFFLNFYLR